MTFEMILRYKGREQLSFCW